MACEPSWIALRLERELLSRELAVAPHLSLTKHTPKTCPWAYGRRKQCRLVEGKTWWVSLEWDEQTEVQGTEETNFIFQAEQKKHNFLHEE